MMKNTLIASSLLTLVACAHATPTAERNGILTTPEGRSLYTFDKDGAGKSQCNGACAVTWPPFVVTDTTRVAPHYTVVAREDGRHQWAYKGMPLYLFVGDSQPGDIKGDKQGGVWHVLRSAAPTTASSYFQSAY